ncbi:cytochrome p450 [Trichoderma cornu-damae]|uniref:Cytochrome p450 n=1 Tax=Trichoderma cornu-damae TaxID=654480 RepID=A0A9P8TVR0_9HYPO|nr:cytochrome p450 [Trichoderma cornu-damae]
MYSGFANHDQLETLLARDAQPRLFVVLMAAFAILSTLTKWIYNLHLHPQRKIPGPRLAAMTGLYEFWFDVVMNGQYSSEIKRMHEVYGPVVRISPREIHIQEPKQRSIIRTPGVEKVRTKPAAVSFAIATPVAAKVDHHHRARHLNSLLLQAVQNRRSAYVRR